MSFAFSVLHIKATVLLHVCLNNEMLVCLFLNLKAILLNVLKPRLLGNIINLKVFFHHDKLQQASRAVLKGGGGGVLIETGEVHFRAALAVSGTNISPTNNRPALAVYKLAYQHMWAFNCGIPNLL